MGMLETLVCHPEEIPALLKLKLAVRTLKHQVPPEPHWSFCYRILQNVSRSFAIVIQQLNPQLRNAVCAFYLVLRALDTVEDDMSIPVDEKLPILKSFHETLYDPSWHYICGEKDYKELMINFHHVSTAFLSLALGYREVITEMTQRMANGMAKFIVEEVETVEDYEEYCHYVAGIVGLGLSRLFFESGREDFVLDVLSNSMGLFLQKTNIIRDYLEDINEIPAPRMFWPREIWCKYASHLEDLKEEINAEDAVKCLNDMITNALKHGTDSLKYLVALRDPAILRFCAIPQIMAMGTLAVCYNNVQVFRGVVKLRRGLTAKLIDETRTISDVYSAFEDFGKQLSLKINDKDPSAEETRKYIQEIQQACRKNTTSSCQSTLTVKSNFGHKACLVFTLLVLLAVMLLIVYH